jgi:hypothetical protein
MRSEGAVVLLPPIDELIPSPSSSFLIVVWQCYLNAAILLLSLNCCVAGLVPTRALLEIEFSIVLAKLSRFLWLSDTFLMLILVLIVGDLF